MGMREEFEAWVVWEAESREYGYMDWLLIRDLTGTGYSTTWVDMTWMGWQASRASLVVTLPDREVYEYDAGYTVYDMCAEAITAAGVTINTTTVNGSDAS